MKDERFKGTTAFNLQLKYGAMVWEVKKKYPGIKDSEITSQCLKSYLDGISKRSTKLEKDCFWRRVQDYIAIKEKLKL